MMDTISKIPPELLSHIFEATSLVDPDSPLVLSLVCRYFHRVTIASPRVWCQLHITLSQSPHSDSSAIRKTKLWFSRSRTCDISLEITGTGRSTGTAAKDALDLLRGKSPKSELGTKLPSVIRGEVGRVEKLTLRFPTEYQIRCLLRDIYPASLYDTNVTLRYLNIEVLSPTLRFSISVDLPLDISPLPNLAHLHLSNCSLDTLPLSTFAHLKELTIHNHLRAQPILLPDLLRILNATEELEVLDIESRASLSSDVVFRTSVATAHPLSSTSVQTASASPTETNERLILPHLSNLSLRTNNIPSILDSIIPPSLHTLSLDDLDGNRPDAAKELGESLKRLIVRMDMPLAKLSSSSSSSMSGASDSSSISESTTSTSNAHTKSTGLNTLTLRNTSFPPLLLSHWVPVWEWCFRRMRHLRKVEVPWIVGDLIAAASDSDSSLVGGSDSDFKENRSGQQEDSGECRESDEDSEGGRNDRRAPGSEIPCPELVTVIMPRCPGDVMQRFKSLRPSVVVVT